MAAAMLLISLWAGVLANNNIVTLYIRSVEPEFRPLGLNLILRDHRIPVRSKFAARYLL
jgi:hypothetical protein